MRRCLFIAVFASIALPCTTTTLAAQTPDLDALADGLEEKVIAWRRDIHQHPELSNREFRTAAMVADHLESLGIAVTREVAHTGVVGVLEGGNPGPVVALRADMDALPVLERNDLPFRSEATGEYRGETVPVMHACGHDTHVAILMGVAEALAGMRDELSGTVKFIFQPAEEGAPEGEEGGAELMTREGVLQSPDVDAIFGLHIAAQQDVGTLRYRSGPFMAAVQDMRIVVRGRQTHGAAPWAGVDPIVTASQIVVGLQTIVSRTVNITENPAIVTVGKFTGGVRSNIVPEEVELLGTIRTFDPEQTETVHRRIREIATNIAEAAGATAEVQIPYTTHYPVTYNDPELTSTAIESLARVAGEDNVVESTLITGAEDFSYFAEEVPGFFVFLGGKPLDVAEEDAAAHHTPDFYIDESGLMLGFRGLMALTLDYMEANAPLTP
ncbi:MAG: amidohydrolase [Gemmatimonadota bacterium]|nr:amidohydrolase [Gemmatimonadota bacterium]